jgi:hypothetical protein
MEDLENRARDFCAALNRFPYMPESELRYIEIQIDRNRDLWLALCNSKCGRTALLDLVARWTTTGKSAWVFRLLTQNDPHLGEENRISPLAWYLDRSECRDRFRSSVVDKLPQEERNKLQEFHFRKGVYWDISEQAWWTRNERLLTEEEDV